VSVSALAQLSLTLADVAKPWLELLKNGSRRRVCSEFERPC
jgi:hypothetical protein